MKARQLLLAALALLAASLAQGEAGDIHSARAKLKASVDQATADYLAKLPKDAYVRRPDGHMEVNHERADIKQLDEAWRAKLKQLRVEHSAGDRRFDDLNKMMEKAGVGDGSVKNSGSKPRTINSDMDVTEMIPGAGEKLVKELKANGYEVEKLPDRWVVKQTDTTIWRKPDDVEIGSPAHREQARRMASADDVFPTKGGQFETSNGAVGTADPEGAVLANAKKFSDACGTCDPVTQLEKIDGHTLSKSVSKAAEWTGTKDGSDFFKQSDAMRKDYASWEEAGVCHAGDPPEVKAIKIQKYLDEAAARLAAANEAGRKQSQQLDDLRTRQAADADTKGSLEESAGYRDQQIDTKISNQETMKRLADVDPQLAARLNGTKLTANPDGTFTNAATGEKLTPSQARELAMKPANQDLVQTTEKVIKETKLNEGPAKPTTETPTKPTTETPTKPTTETPTKPTTETPAKPTLETPAKPTVEGEPPAGAASKALKAGGLLVLIYGIYEGYKTGHEKAAEEKQAGDSDLKTSAKAWGYTLIYGLGIGGAWDEGKKAGLEAAKQFKEDLEAGKNPSVAGAKARAVLWGVGGFLKGMTIDPLINGGTAIKEGLGAIGDNVKAHLRSREADAAVTEAKDYCERRRRERREREAKERLQKVAKETSGRRDGGLPLDRGVPVDRGPAGDIDLRALVIARLEAYDLPTDDDIVQYLLDVLTKQGPKGLEARVVELSKTQGTCTGTLQGFPRLTLVVNGKTVDGKLRVTGPANVTADLSGSLDLLKAKIKFSGLVTERKGKHSTSGAATFTGTFKGSGYSGSMSGRGMRAFSWQVTCRREAR
jgi:hypothetical protein